MRHFEKPVLVTRPYLPPLDDFGKGVREIWENQWLTNDGPMLGRFQTRLSETLGIPENRLALFVNGTLALEIVYQTLGLNVPGAEVITTPFTFVATSHAIRRVGATPVFADVDPDTLCLTPEAAERCITDRTRAIVPVHVYGHPCDVEGFAKLAAKYDLRLIYDAAHAFGETIDGRSIAEWGDASMFSFHATKLFHSIEGGLVAFRKPEHKPAMEHLRNFAITSETTCDDVGTNAKMNEFAALMGLCCLDVLPDLLAHRKAIYDAYAEAFAENPRVRLLPCPDICHGHHVAHNHAYCPILLPNFDTRERVYAGLKDANVYTRRYFYPLLTDFAPYRAHLGHTPIARDAADRVLTLPTYHTLSLVDARDIARNVLELLT